jgi:hypothetical protein
MNILPFKSGEILRILAFAHVYGWRRKALAVWLVERFGDVIVLTLFILSMYLFNIQIPQAMHVVFIAFALIGLLGLAFLFATTKVFAYLTRHLVLTSHTRRSLLLLRVGHALHLLEKDIHQSVEGRLTGFIVLTIFIWSLVIITLALLQAVLAGISVSAAQFTNALLEALSSGVTEESLNVYIFLSLTLGVMHCISLVIQKTISLFIRGAGRVPHR